MKYHLICCFFSILIFAIGCSSSSDDVGNCTTQFSESFEDELATVSAASTAYGMDPTSENCEAFKQAYKDYLDALETWEDCANINNQVTQWQQAIDAAQMAADNIVC